MNGLRILLALVFAAACAYTVLGYPSRYGALTGRSRLFRTVGLFLFDLLLGLILLGTLIDFGYGTDDITANVRSLAYAMACLFLALTLVCIAVLDWLESLVAYRREQRELFQRMVRGETDEARKGEDAGKENGPGDGDER